MSDYMASDEEDSSDDGRRSGDPPKLAPHYVSKPALYRRSSSYQRSDKKTTVHSSERGRVTFSPKDENQISMEAQSNGELRVTQTKWDKPKNQTKYHDQHRLVTRNPVPEHQRGNQYWNPRQQPNRIEAPTRSKATTTKPNMPQNQTQAQPVKKEVIIHRPSERPREAQYDTGQRRTLVNASGRNRRPMSYHGTAANGPPLQREPTSQIYPQYGMYDSSNGIVGTVIGLCQACLTHQRTIPSEQCTLHHGYGMDLYGMPLHPPSNFDRPLTSRALSAPYPGAISMVGDDHIYYHRPMPPPREMRKNSVSPPPYYYSVPPSRRARRTSVSPPLPTPIELTPNGIPAPTPTGLRFQTPPPNRFDYNPELGSIDSSRSQSALDVNQPPKSAPTVREYPSPHAPPRTSTPLGGYSSPPSLRQQIGGVNLSWPYSTIQSPWPPYPTPSPSYVPTYDSEQRPSQRPSRTNLRETEALVPNRRRSTMGLSDIRSAPLNRQSSKSNIHDVDFPVLNRRRSRNKIREIESASPNNNSGASFKWDIHIMNAARKSKPAVALLDTQCQIGNWIAQALVQRLDALSSISPLNDPPSLGDANGWPVQTSGTITLSFKRHNGNRWHECDFYVLPPSTRHIDVILGVAYIVEHELIVVNDSAHLPILERQKVSKEEKAAIAIAEERRRQEKVALEARRQERAEQDAYRLTRQMSRTTLRQTQT